MDAASRIVPASARLRAQTDATTSGPSVGGGWIINQLAQRSGLEELARLRLCPSAQITTIFTAHFERPDHASKSGLRQ